MSWWDTSGITNLASQALKNAQKKIDKVLDIEEDGSSKKKGTQPSNKTASKSDDTNKETKDGDFWSSWLGAGGKKGEGVDEAGGSSSSQSSWNLPWNLSSNSSEHIDRSGGDTAASVTGKVPEAGFEESESTTPAIEDVAVSSPSHTEASVSSTTQVTEKKIDAPLAETTTVLSEARLHNSQNEQNILNSDSFTSDWQDFPMDGDIPGEDYSVNNDSIDLGACNLEIQQKLNENTTGSLSFTESKVKSFDTEVIDKDTKHLSGVESENDSLNYTVSKSHEDTNVDSTVKKFHEIASEGSESNVTVPLLEVSSKPLENSHNNPEGWPLFAQGVANDSQLALLQEPEPFQLPNLSSENNLLVDYSKELSVIQDGRLSKASSSSSFIAVSEESATEPMPFVSSTGLNTDTLPQGSSTPVENIPTEVTESSDTEVLLSSSSTILSPVKQLQEKSVLPFSETSHHTDSEPLFTADDGDILKNVTTHEKNINVEPVLPEMIVSSDSQKSQSDYIQEYVNINSMNDGSQTVSFEDSAVLSEDLPASTDMDMVTSRTSSDPDLPGGGRASSTGSSDTSKFDSSIDTVVDRTVIDSQSDIDLIEKEPPYSFFGDNQAADNENDASGVSHVGQLNDSSQSLSSSYVKCMIEEAMEDLSKTEDSGSDNHSSGEKSESSKVDSELEKSVYSGHESSDEIETTTSSDIEIISAPTPNGDNKYHIPFDLSPLKIALQRTVRDQGHHRSDSQSSSSVHSKAGEIDRMSPERGDGASWRDDDYHHHDLHAVREEGVDNPSHPERLLKKLAEMAEILQARENKLVHLSKENHQLLEDNSILRNQLQQSEEAREAENADLTALTDEFTARIGEAEKKIQAALKEKESLKQRLASTEKELERRSGNSDLQALLDEKNEQVQELLKEGEKLSKQQLQNSNIIKKLREKEKKNDATVATQKKKLDEQAKELERLIVVLDSKEELEKKQAEAINQLNAAVQRQEKELIKYKSDLEDAQEKCRGLQTALDNSYKEIAELHRSNASQDSKAQEAALSAETQVREELKAAMEREQQRFRQEREAFIMQIDDLRLDMARLEKEHSRREDLLRQEITHLQERLQLDEARSQDLTQSVTSATRPLLRQIENLQATFGAQSSAWERVEKSLTDRLTEAQKALAMAQENERTANDDVRELSARVASLEAANSRIKQERAQLAAQVESDRTKLEDLQDVRNSTVAQLESSKQKLTQELTQLKLDKVHLESQLNVERTRLENEKKKTFVLEEQLRQAERPRSRGTPSPSPSMSVSRQESMAGSMYEHQSPSVMNWSYHDDGESVSTFGGPKTSVYDSLRQSGAAVVFENLSSQLKLKEGEIAHMQSEISQLERTRESMARELVNLTNQNDELLEIKKSHEQLLEQFNELNSRYSAILQMYGEKEEQVQELRLDLQDVKEMYKSQIDALLAK